MKQINVLQFNKLSEADKLPYVMLFTSLKAKEWLKIDINQLTYNEVRNIFKRLSTASEVEDVFKIFEMALKIEEIQFYELPLQKFFQIKKYLNNYFVNLQKKETQLLQTISEDIGIWEMAGGDSLNEFGDVLPLSQLAKIYGGYPFDYGEKKYIEIIYLLRMNNVQSKVEAEYQKLKSKK
jgi:hypothetical protein